MSQTPTSPLRATDDATLSSVTSGIASMVWWQFCGTRITPDDLRSRVSAAGFDPAAVKDIDPVQALHRAAREFSHRDGKKRTMEAAIAHEDTASVVVNLLELQRQSARKVAKVPVETLIWDKATSSWSTPGAGAHAAKLRGMVLDRQTYCDGNDVRDQLVMPALAASSCFTLRRGMYVVPNATAQPVAEAQAALHGLESFQLHVASVQKGHGWEQPMKQAADEQLRNELTELSEQIEGWKDMASRVRSDTQAHVLARFKSLRSRATLYAEALSVSLEDLEDDVAEMEKLAIEVIEGKDAEADTRIAANAPKPVDPSQALREALAAMPVKQLRTLWMALCDGEMPTEEAELIEAVAVAREGAAAA